jgi:hypothetical protein
MLPGTGGFRTIGAAHPGWTLARGWIIAGYFAYSLVVIRLSRRAGLRAKLVSTGASVTSSEHGP